MTHPIAHHFKPETRRLICELFTTGEIIPSARVNGTGLGVMYQGRPHCPIGLGLNIEGKVPAGYFATYTKFYPDAVTASKMLDKTGNDAYLISGQARDFINWYKTVEDVKEAFRVR